MRLFRTAAWLVVLATVVALQAPGARGGDVTIIGSNWRSPTAPLSDPSLQERPPMPDGFVPPNGEVFAPNAKKGAADGPNQPVGPAEATEATIPPLLVYTDWPLQSSWYTRFDYFSWRERYGGYELLNEHGTIYNLGYMRSSGAKRARIEVFSGRVNYGSSDRIFPLYPVSSTTTYMGVRGEFELLWDMNLHGWPAVTCFGGLGMRFWVRDIKDGVFPDSNTPWAGHQENWLVLYPYLGIEKRWPMSTGDEFFASGRIGSTAGTWMYQSYENAATLCPHPSMTGQVECGVRHEALVFSAFFDGMAWNASGTERGRFQPTTETYTAGLKIGLSY